MYTWGRGDDGRLGHGDNGWKYVPRVVEALEGQRIVQVREHGAQQCDTPPFRWSQAMGDAGRGVYSCVLSVAGRGVCFVGGGGTGSGGQVEQGERQA